MTIVTILGPDNDNEVMPPEEPMPDIVLSHLTIEAFRGLELLDIDLPPSGVIFAGSKGIGKTSALRAIEALLKGLGVGAEAIHLDHEKAKLRLDFSKAEKVMLAKRTIRHDRTTLELLNGDGTAVPRAKEQLRAIFGERSLDPLALWAADAKERRRMILEAIPCQVTADDLDQWCETSGVKWSVDGHGHEVLSRVREMKFAERTAANARVENVRSRIRVAEEEASRLRPGQETDITPEAARTHVTVAEQELARLSERARMAEKREAEAASTRAKIVELRGMAEARLAMPEATGPSDDAVGAAEKEEAAAESEVRRLEEALRVAQAACAEKAKAVAALQAAKGQAGRLMAEAQGFLDRAEELDKAIDFTLDGDGDPIALQAAAAEEGLAQAKQLVALAEATAKYRQATAGVEALGHEAAAALAEADKLDRVVRRLTKDVPGELAKRANAIPGLEITATAITFQGKSIDLLSDGEKLEFAVEIAKRTTTGAKVLLIDGLERLPPSLQPGFVRRCLEGGWVLFGTRVQDGALEVVDCWQLAQAA